jgi:hypothetical protein
MAELGGRHIHRRTNPARIEYEFALFTSAPGCTARGEAQLSDTWFAGYGWQIALCGRCFGHLGWRFSTTGAELFGLIVTEIREE